MVAAQSLGGLRRTTRSGAAGIGAPLAVVLLAAVGILTWITVGRALDPVREMTASAADWSEHDLAQRFGARRVPMSSASSHRTSTRCWTAWPRACATSSDCRPSSRTSSVRRWRGSWPRSSSAAAQALGPPRIAATAYAVVSRSRRADERHPRDPDGRGPRRGAARLGRSEVGDVVLEHVAEGWAPALAERDVELEVRRSAAPMMAGVDARSSSGSCAPHRQRRAATRGRASCSSADARDGAIVLSVADHGPGVAAEQPRLRLRARVAWRAVNGHGGAGARPAAGAPPRPGRRRRRDADRARSGVGRGVPGAPPREASAGCPCARSSSARAAARRRGRAGRCRRGCGAAGGPVQVEIA